MVALLDQSLLDSDVSSAGWNDEVRIRKDAKAPVQCFLFPHHHIFVNDNLATLCQKL